MGSKTSRIRLPGWNKTRSKGVIRVYAWRGRGAPCIGTYATDAEMEADAAGLAGRYEQYARPKPSASSISGLVADFRASDTFRAYADSTKRAWGTHLDAIDVTFGATRVADIQKKGARPLIKRWHRSMSTTPRKANYALTVLNRVFTWAIDEERMERNPAEGIQRLEEAATTRPIRTWTRAEFDRLLKHCSPSLSRALRLMWLTGLRRGDLVGLTWSDVDFDLGLIRRATNKSRRGAAKKARLAARIAITDELAALLDEFPRTSVQVATTEKGRPFASPEALYSVFSEARRAAGLRKIGLHDIRHTEITRHYSEGGTDEEAESRYGWGPGQGAKMRHVYADLDKVAIELHNRRRNTG